MHARKAMTMGDVLFNRGLEFFKANDAEGAVKVLSQAIVEEPGDKEAFFLRGQAYRIMRDYLRAEADFAVVLRLDPAHAMARMWQANVQLDLGKVKDGIAIYTGLIAMYRHPATESQKEILEAALSNRAHAYRMLGQKQEAGADFEEVLRLNPGNSVALTGYAAICHESGRDELALKYYTSVIECFLDEDGELPDSLISPERVTRALRGRGILYYRQGRLREAIIDLGLAADLDCHDAQSFLFRGLAYLNQGNLKQAGKDFDLACILDSGKAMPFIYQAYFYTLMGNPLQTVRLLDNLAFLNGRIPLLYLFRAIAQEALGQPGPAKSDYIRAWNCKSPFTSTKLYCGLRLLGMGIPAQDLALVARIQEMAAVTLRSAEDICILTLAQLVTGQHDAAKTSCQQLLNSFLPAAIPLFLRRDYIEMLSSPCAWPVLRSIQISAPLIEEYKDQLVDMIKCTADPQLQINAALQGLCRETVFGRILYTPRNGGHPSVRSGRLEILAAYLEENIDKAGALVPLSEATVRALKHESSMTPSFKTDLAKKYPRLYAAIGTHLGRAAQSILTPGLFSFTPALAGRPAVENPSIQSDCGNRFIVSL